MQKEEAKAGSKVGRERRVPSSVLNTSTFTFHESSFSSAVYRQYTDSRKAVDFEPVIQIRLE